MPFLDKEGLAHFWNHVVARLNNKVEREELVELENTLRAEIGGNTAITDTKIDEICGAAIYSSSEVEL